MDAVKPTPYEVASGRGWCVLQDHPLPVVWEKRLGDAMVRVEARGNVRGRLGPGSGWIAPLWTFDRQFSLDPRRPSYAELFEYGDRVLRILHRIGRFSLDDLDVALDVLEGQGADETA